jgi:hypothetical protein
MMVAARALGLIGRDPDRHQSVRLAWRGGPVVSAGIDDGVRTQRQYGASIAMI